jgi:predicted DNA-binding transcriptional regulator AlpA
MTHRKLLNETQASEVTGFAVKTLRKRRWEGKAPRFLKLGSKVMYDFDDLQNYLKSCIRNSTSDQGESRNKGGVK